jgi:hypothetical protein
MSKEKISACATAHAGIAHLEVLCAHAAPVAEQRETALAVSKGLRIYFPGKPEIEEMRAGLDTLERLLEAPENADGSVPDLCKALSDKLALIAVPPPAEDDAPPARAAAVPPPATAEGPAAGPAAAHDAG